MNTVRLFFFVVGIAAVVYWVVARTFVEALR